MVRQECKRRDRVVMRLSVLRKRADSDEWLNSLAIPVEVYIPVSRFSRSANSSALLSCLRSSSQRSFARFA